MISYSSMKRENSKVVLYCIDWQYQLLTVRAFAVHKLWTVSRFLYPRCFQLTLPTSMTVQSGQKVIYSGLFSITMTKKNRSLHTSLVHSKDTVTEMYTHYTFKIIYRSYENVQFHLWHNAVGAETLTPVHIQHAALDTINVQPAASYASNPLNPYPLQDIVTILTEAHAAHSINLRCILTAPPFGWWCCQKVWRARIV